MSLLWSCCCLNFPIWSRLSSWDWQNVVCWWFLCIFKHTFTYIYTYIYIHVPIIVLSLSHHAPIMLPSLFHHCSIIFPWFYHHFPIMFPSLSHHVATCFIRLSIAEVSHFDLCWPGGFQGDPSLKRALFRRGYTSYTYELHWHSIVYVHIHSYYLHIYIYPGIPRGILCTCFARNTLLCTCFAKHAETCPTTLPWHTGYFFPKSLLECTLARAGI